MLNLIKFAKSNATQKGYFMNYTAMVFLSIFCLLVVTPCYANKHIPKKTDIIAVKIYTSDCRECATMSPIFKKVKEKYKNTSIVMLDLDISNQQSRQKAQKTAESYGITKIYQKFPQKGYVFLIDKKSKQILGRLDASQSFEEMSMVIDSVLNGVPMTPQGYFIPENEGVGERKAHNAGLAPGVS